MLSPVQKRLSGVHVHMVEFRITRKLTCPITDNHLYDLERFVIIVECLNRVLLGESIIAFLEHDRMTSDRIKRNVKLRFAMSVDVVQNDVTDFERQTKDDDLKPEGISQTDGVVKTRLSTGSTYRDRHETVLCDILLDIAHQCFEVPADVHHSLQGPIPFQHSFSRFLVTAIVSLLYRYFMLLENL
ncbi:hypothetical protein RsoM2USA_297 [Ralstonia phage RsoM2USA]|nr:hypothetical protein RsoM2USA_297 [Ralstonia phage RsoM2USA]